MRLRACTLSTLAKEYGGEVRGSGDVGLGRFVPVEDAGAGDLAPLIGRRFVRAGIEARSRGASLLIDAKLTEHPEIAKLEGWVHPFGPWAMALVLSDLADVSESPPRFGFDVTRGEHAVSASRVVVGARVRLGACSVIGGQGFGWVTGPKGEVLQVPHLGGVVLEDDVYVGAHTTIDAGILGPTVIRRGVKIDAHVHVGHNCDIGEGSILAAQCGLAGSVKLGRGVLVGGQAGFADHVTVGDGARIAAKSGVIGDVPAGAVFAGYPAVARVAWLRGIARAQRRK